MPRLKPKDHDLEPCPFCGRNDNIVCHQKKQEGWSIGCMWCIFELKLNATFADAVAMWNRRVSGMINRKMNCPTCGPKFRKAEKKFVREVDRLLDREKRHG